ncbi:hypothetical protein SK128_015089, partial [Halocaridina rubra]
MSLDMQRIVEHTLRIAPDTGLTLNDVLNQLQSYIKGQCSEALCRCKFLCIKQAD